MKNHHIIQKLKDKIFKSNSMPNREILNVQKECEMETNITLRTIENQEKQESELLREEIEIFEAMEEQFIQDDVEAGPSTRGDTHIPHSHVKVVGKGKRLTNKGCSPKRSNSAKEKISPNETVESDKTIQTIE